MRALLLQTPSSATALEATDPGIWIAAGETVFRIDREGAIVASFRCRSNESVLDIVDGHAIVHDDEVVRSVAIADGSERWSTKIDKRYPDGGARWWFRNDDDYESHLFELELTRGKFRERHVGGGRRWSDRRRLVIAQREMLLVFEPGTKKPTARMINGELGWDPLGPLPFADDWYVASNIAGERGRATRVSSTAGGEREIDGALAGFELGTQVHAVLVRRNEQVFAHAWSDGSASEVLIDGRNGFLGAVGPTVAAIGDTQFNVAAVDEPGWITLPCAGGLPTQVRDGDALYLALAQRRTVLVFALDDLLALGPGCHPLTLATVDLTPPPVSHALHAEVASVGATTGTIIAMHPEYGRLVIVAPGTDVRPGDRLEILEHKGGSRVGAWRRVGDPAPIAKAPKPPKPQTLPAPTIAKPRRARAAPSNTAKQWAPRARKARIETPPILARLWARYDESPRNRALLTAAFGELDPEATFSEEPKLVGFANNVEGMAIGLMPGKPGVWTYDDGELMKIEASVEAWLETRLDWLDAPPVVAQVRALLELKKRKR